MKSVPKNMSQDLLYQQGASLSTLNSLQGTSEVSNCSSIGRWRMPLLFSRWQMLVTSANLQLTNPRTVSNRWCSVQIKEKIFILELFCCLIPFTLRKWLLSYVCMSSMLINFTTGVITSFSFQQFLMLQYSPPVFLHFSLLIVVSLQALV